MCLYFKRSIISCIVIWHLTHSERWVHFVYIELGLWWMAGWYNWFQNSTNHSHAWKSQWGYFCVFVEVYLWQRFSRGLESNQRLVSKVIGVSALLQSSPAAAGYLEELSSGEERQSKSSCQGFDVWHSFVSECNTEHKQSCTLEEGKLLRFCSFTQFFLPKALIFGLNPLSQVSRRYLCLLKITYNSSQIQLN